ncbi:MAG: tRNA epoxyqueuosine(34) reductase QueG [Gammaproteobacteria bacterium]|nr:tRNA epoxyqueuosine(34) reductase QueG [Gammaproteobacteria bacterium]
MDPGACDEGVSRQRNSQRDREVALARLASDIETWARELGFAAVGIADTDLSDYAPDVRRWLSRKLHGSMGYMARNVDKRLRPERLHEGTVRVISARMDYLTEAAPAISAPRSETAYVSRYALGRDYHKTVRRRLVRLARRIDRHAGGRYRAFTDSAPVLEKPLAEKAGLGWIGKNTLLLNEEAGSLFFLGEIYTSLPLPVTEASVPDRCGACRACLKVCPTDALVGPRQLDARRCISYLTIESKGAIPPELREAVGNRIFGCDDCQVVCPWNRYARKSAEADFAPRHGLDSARIADLLAWDEATFLARTEGMALRRIDYRQWVRNLAVAAGNAVRSPELVARLQVRRADADDMVREHIDWALTRLEGAAAR